MEVNIKAHVKAELGEIRALLTGFVDWLRAVPERNIEEFIEKLQELDQRIKAIEEKLK